MQILNLATEEKQNEILSNFPISGGTDFDKKNPQVVGVTTNHASTTMVDLQGSGYISAIAIDQSTSGINATFSIQIDGGSIHPLRISSYNGTISFPLFKFKHSLKISSSGTPAQVWVVLD